MFIPPNLPLIRDRSMSEKLSVTPNFFVLIKLFVNKKKHSKKNSQVYLSKRKFLNMFIHYGRDKDHLNNFLNLGRLGLKEMT